MNKYIYIFISCLNIFQIFDLMYLIILVIILFVIIFFIIIYLLKHLLVHIFLIILNNQYI